MSGKAIIIAGQPIAILTKSIYFRGKNHPAATEHFVAYCAGEVWLKYRLQELRQEIIGESWGLDSALFGFGWGVKYGLPLLLPAPA